jgi:hypothetical protein
MKDRTIVVGAAAQGPAVAVPDARLPDGDAGSSLTSREHPG